MVSIKVAAIDISKDKPFFLPLLTRFYPHLLLPFSMLFQRFQDHASKPDLTPTCFCFWLTLDITYPIHIRHITSNL